MVLEAVVLGTSGSIPLPRRQLSSILLCRAGEKILFDCGEGLQVSLRQAAISWKKIQVVCISHSHADHVTGLPGLLMLSAQVERDRPLTIVCPERVRNFLEATRETLGMHINFKINYVLLEALEKNSIVYHNENNEYYIKAFPGEHVRQVWGFSVIENERPGKFDVARAVKLKIPRGPYWSQLQRGETLRLGDRTYYPADVLGSPRKGRKVVYITDTRPSPVLVKEMQGADLVFIEGMFKHEHLETAREKSHLTGVEAATMLKKSGNIKKAGLLHFSQRYTNQDIEEIEKEAQAIFHSLVCCKEKQSFTIEYKK